MHITAETVSIYSKNRSYHFNTAAFTLMMYFVYQMLLVKGAN